jgi:sulfonate transport system substrate-binding protein
MKKKLVSILAVAVAASQLMACNSTGNQVDASQQQQSSQEEEQEIVIRVANFDYASWNAAFDVAYGLGYFDDAFDENVSVEVSNFTNGPAVNEAFLAGEVDIVNGIGDQPIITALSTGQNNYILASATQEPAFGLIVAPDSGIETIADLAGKNIQCTIGTSGHKIVLQYLAQAGLTGDDVNLVNLQDDDAARAGLVSGDLDAIFLSGINYLRAEEQGIGVRLEGAADVPLYAYIEASGEFVEKYPHVTEEFLAAVQRGKEYLDENPEDAYQVISDVTQYDYDYVKELVEACDYSLDLTDEVVDNLYTTSQFLVDQGLIQNEVSEEEIQAHVSDILDNIELK